MPSMIMGARQEGWLSHDFHVGEWLVQPQMNLLSRDGENVRLEPKIMEVLVYLAEHAGEVITKERMLEAVWADAYVSEQVLKVSIFELRKALKDDAKQPRFINTISKRGYQLIAPVSPAEKDGTTHIPAPQVEARSKRGRLWAAALGAVLLLLVLGWGISHWRRSLLQAQPKQIRAIAVLPLKNLSGDASQEFFADGMTDALISDLARLGSLRVISRTSVMRYKEVTKTLPEIARELNVDAVIEGSVIRSGNRVKLTVQLVDAATDQSLWTESYERDLKDVIALQSALAMGIAKQIKVKLRPESAQKRVIPVNPAAYEAYLKGRFFWNKRSHEGFLKSIEYYQQAIEKDPRSALAYAGLADTYTVLGFYSSIRPHEAYAKAKEAAIKALELDDTLAETHTSLAGIKHKYDLDWEGAEREFQRAIHLNPNYPTAHQWYAIHLQSLGKFDEALAEMQKAQELDPLSLIMRADRGWILYTARRYDEAIHQFRQTLEMEPSFQATYFLALAYVKKGMSAEAQAELERAINLNGRSSTYVSLLGYVYAAQGQRAAALKILEELKERYQRDYAIPYQFAIIYAALGDHDQALKWLEQILRDRSSWMPFFKVEPELDGLHSDPRFQALLRRIGLEPSI